MSDRRELTAEEAAEITENIDRAFDFLGDLIAEPGIADLLPPEATIAVRTVQVEGARLRLTAYQTAADSWIARVTRVLPLGMAETEPARVRPTVPTHDTTTLPATLLALHTAGDSAAEALAQLEASLPAALGAR